MLNLPFSALDILLFWITTVSLFWFVYSFFELRRTHKKLKTLRHQEERKWKEVLDKAHKDYQDLISEANAKAQEIIQGAAKIDFDVTTSLKQAVTEAISEHKNELESTSLSLSNKYAGELEEVNKHNIEMLTNVYKDIEIHAKNRFEEYQKALEAQTFQAQDLAKKRIEEEYAKLQTELENLKSRRVAELESRIQQTVQTIAKDIIGHSLSSTDQGELITQALERAKKEGVI